MCTIVLAEDDLILRENLEYFLKLEGFNVLAAGNGKAAYHLIITNHTDIVVSDVQMPFMNGLELTKKLKDNLETRFIPIILISAEPASEQEIKGRSLGAEEYLIKPFNLSDLLEIIIKNKNKN